MLKLKKVQILGFKSFCDRTEVQLVGRRDCGGGGAERVRQVEHLGRDYVGAGGAVGQEPARDEDGRRDLCGDARAQADGDGGGVADAGRPGGVRRRVAGRRTDGEGDWSSDGSSERALELAGDWDEAELRQMRAAETEEAVRRRSREWCWRAMGSAEVEGDATHDGETAADGAPDAGRTGRTAWC